MGGEFVEDACSCGQVPFMHVLGRPLGTDRRDLGDSHMLTKTTSVPVVNKHDKVGSDVNEKPE